MFRLPALSATIFLLFFLVLRTAAVLERGIAYVDNLEEGPIDAAHDFHKRSHGVGVIEIKAERAAAPGIAIGSADTDTDGNEWGKKRGDTPWGSAPADDMGDSHEWGKRGSNWDGAPSEDGTDSHEWGNRGIGKVANVEEGACASCMKRSSDWKWAPQWLNSLRKRFLGSIRGDVEDPANIGPGPTKQKARSAKAGQIDGGKRSDDILADGGPYQTQNEDGAEGGPDESHDWLMKRSGISPFEAAQPFSAAKPFPPSGKSLKMNKRGLIEDWMHPRAMEKRQSCVDPGWVPCGSSPGCCPTIGSCCATGCKNTESDVCCPGYSCDAGYQCDRLCGGCTLAGGGCCPDGIHTCGPGEACCPDGCVDTGASCCSNGGSCAAGLDCCNDGCAPEGNACCQGGGNCPAGTQCCEDGCAREGNQCCRGGGSCGAGNICVLYNGEKGCCTDLSCTAWISDGVRVPLTPTVTAPPSTRTATQGVDVYYTYYFTITWWYYYYYYVYYAVLDVSTVTSSETTIYTTVTLTNTAPEAASSEFDSISSSVVDQLTTPVEATTALATPTLPANTAGDAGSGDASTEDGSGQEVTVTGGLGGTSRTSRTTTSTRSTPTGPRSGGEAPPGTGSAAMVEINRWLGWGMGAVAMGAGVGMVWL